MILGIDSAKAATRGAAARGARTPRVVVFLGGSVRPTPLSRSVGRSLLDLPVTPDRTVLQLWLDEVARVAGAVGAHDLPVRVVIDRGAPEPTLGAAHGLRVSVERDPAELRGTGGLLRDVAAAYEPDDEMLVLTAAQVPLTPLPPLVDELLGTPGDVRFVAHEDGEPAGAFYVRCGALSGLNPVGFLDFKEQVLPKLAAAGQEIRVVRRREATAWPVRTVRSYIEALRRHHRLQAGLPAARDPFAESWRRDFLLVEPGAQVDQGATLQDCVVLRGGRVERGAVAVASVVGPGGVLRPGRPVVDDLVADGAGRETAA